MLTNRNGNKRSRRWYLISQKRCGGYMPLNYSELHYNEAQRSIYYSETMENPSHPKT